MAYIRINFLYMGKKEIIECYIDEYMDNIFKRYATKIQVDLDNLYFLCNGNVINPEDKLRNILKENENETINIIVEELNKDEDEGINLKQSKHIICPICNEICLIKLNDYRISFSNCKNGHRFTKITFEEFFDFQTIDESKIICDKCEGEDKNKKSEVIKNLFFKCCTCNINLCPLCKSNHEKSNKKHIIINYDDKSYLCNEHGERYISHCHECNKDACDECRYNDIHYSSYHKYSFLYELPKKKENKMNELRIKIDNLKKKTSKNTSINYVIKDFEIYFNIANSIINSLDRKNINFYTLNNINNIIEYNGKIIKDINKILNEEVEIDKFIYEIEERMLICDVFILKYKIGKVGILRIFSKPFVAKNINKFFMKINKKNYDLSSTVKIIDIETGKTSNKIIKSQQTNGKIDENEDNIEIINEGPEISMKIKEELEIRLIQIKTVKDLSFMFSGCTNLVKIENSNWDTSNVTDMSGIFNGCSSLTTLPDISKWNTNNVTNMEAIFNNCSSLTSLPDISKWNTNNVTDMGGIFCNCSSLTSLPDISNWKTNNVNNMKSIFNNCSSLTSLPDISKWNTNNVNNMSFLFNSCSSLTSLPDISKWKTNNVIELKCIFSSCSSLTSLPDISKWNTNNVTDIAGIFKKCSLLTSLPDISKWNTSKVNNMTAVFMECSSLTSLPDISKWNTNNVTNLIALLSHCSSLTTLPDISKWNTNNVTDMAGIFNRCSSLTSVPDISKWNINNVKYMENLFDKCSSLTSIPDISLWNTNNVTNMNYIFNECKFLKSLPDISIWNTNNVTQMKGTFNKCSSLTSLPDISKWNTNNVTNMRYIFGECKFLKSLPDISKWNTNNVIDMTGMFNGCSSLTSLPDISKWNTNNVKYMDNIFNNCSSLTSLPDFSK